MMPKKQEYKRRQRKGILTKRRLENQRDRGKKREPEDVALQNDTQKCNTFEITISYKKVIGWDTTFIS